MAQPTLYQILPFDSTLSFDFTFTYSNSQVFKNRLIIKKNIDNTVIYNQIIESRLLVHVLPLNTLTNGVTYNAQLSVFDINNNESLLSNTIVFTCYSTPVFAFSNLIENQVIENSYYDFTLSYSQSQNRELNSYQVILYNSNQSQIYTTGTIYDVSNLLQTLRNFDNNTNYFIKAMGETIDGVVISTALISISVKYIVPIIFSKIIVENVPLLGELQISSNLLSIDGHSNPVNPTYIDNSMVDLSTKDTNVIFDSAFNISDDFLLQMKVKNLTPNQMFMELSNQIESIQLYYMESQFKDSNGDVGYINLKTNGAVLVYSINSEYITKMSLSNSIYSIWIKRINNVYEIKAEMEV